MDHRLGDWTVGQNDHLRLEALQQLSFGEDVAEHEQGLEHYFLRTAAFWAVANDEVDLVLGPKGSGKSAIARYLCDPHAAIDELDTVDVIPAFNIRGSLLFRRLERIEIARDDATQRTFFLAYMVGLIGNHLIANYPDSTQDLLPLMKHSGLLVDNPVNRGIFDRVLQRFQPRVEAGLSMNEVGQPEVIGRVSLIPRIDDGIQVLSDELEAVAEMMADIWQSLGRRCWIVFDRLDEAFPDDPALERSALRGLLRAHLDLGTFGTRMRSKLFLRSDVLERVTRDRGFTNFSHIRKTRIKWDSADVLGLVARRISESGVLRQLKRQGEPGQTPQQICLAVLPNLIGRDRTPTLTWLLLVTPDANRDLNPRNVLTLLRAARFHAIEDARKGQSVVHSSETALIRPRSLGVGHEQLSFARLEDTVLAEGMVPRSYVDALRGRVVQFSQRELGERLELRGPALDVALSELQSAGLLRAVDDIYVLAPLFRPALFDALHEFEIGGDDQQDFADDRTIDRHPVASFTVGESADSSTPTTADGEATPVVASSKRRKRKRVRNRREYRDVMVNGRQLPDSAGFEDFTAALNSELDMVESEPESVSEEISDRLEPFQPQSPAFPDVKTPPRSRRHDGHSEALAFRDVGKYPEAVSSLLSAEHSSAASVCLAADLAYMSEDAGLVQSVLKPLARSDLKRMGSVRGRLFALLLIGDEAERADVVARSLPRDQVTPAVIGLVKMLSQDCSREKWLYRAVTQLVADGALTSGSPLVKSIPVVYASRVLAIARWAAVDSLTMWKGERSAAIEEYWAIQRPAAVRHLHGLLYAYVADPGSAVPRMLPYQVVSVADTLAHVEALPDYLRAATIEAIRSELEQITEEHRANFGRWAEFSTLALAVVS